MKEGAAVSAVLAVVLLAFPWMAFPLSVLGLVGTGKATMDLFDAFWDELRHKSRSYERWPLMQGLLWVSSSQNSKLKLNDDE